MVVYNDTNQPLWASSTNIPEDSTFFANQFSLSAGEFVRTRYRLLEMQDDCNLVLYSVVNALKVAALWESGTAGAGGNCRVDFQSDGNFLVMDEFDQPLWASGTSGTTGAELRLQDDGNVVIYNAEGQPLWVGNTQGISVDVPACGDFVCSASESCSTCVSDCGVCSGPVCGDLVCESAETCSSCDTDCGPCAGTPVPAPSRWGLALLYVAISAVAIRRDLMSVSAHRVAR
jgi:hypothetical protein